MPSLFKHKAVVITSHRRKQRRSNKNYHIKYIHVLHICMQEKHSNIKKLIFRVSSLFFWLLKSFQHSSIVIPKLSCWGCIVHICSGTGFHNSAL